MVTPSLQISGIDHVTIYVKDLDKSVDFYQKLFGFEVRKDQPKTKSKIVGNDAVKLCLYEDPEKAILGGLAHFGLHVCNFSKIVEMCEVLNISMPYGIVDWEEGTRSVYIVDPDGYEIELSEISGGGI